MPKDNATIGDNIGVVEYSDLQQLLDVLAGKKKAVDEANGSLRQKLKEILDDRGFHNGGFAAIRNIERLSETARADFLRTFDPLYQVMKKGKWDQEASDLLSEVETEEKIADAAASPPVDTTEKKSVKNRGGKK